MKQHSNKRFNIIDALIIFIVLVCIVGVCFRGRISEWIGAEKNLESYEITFSVSKVRHTSGKYLTNGSIVKLDSGNMKLGMIYGNCTMVPAEILLESSDGTPIKSNYPQDTYVDVTGQIKCMGIEKDDGFYLNGTYSLTPGMTVGAHTELLDFSITIIDIAKFDK